MIKKFKLKLDKKVILTKPFGFFDFINLEKNCLITMTDSGTVQEESAIFKVPCLILREYTERPETIKAGGAKIVSNNNKLIISSIHNYLNKKIKIKNIDDYMNKNVSSKILKILGI